MRRPTRLIVTLVATGMLVASCSSDDSTTGTTAAPAATSSSSAESSLVTTVEPTTGETTAATTTGDTTPDDTTSASAETTPVTEPATTTTLDVAALAATYTELGPYPVGVGTLALGNGILVEVWYPAVEGSVGTETYDVRDFTAPSIKAILTADIPATFSYAATRDAAVADGVFPVVLNSHGYSGIRVGSSFLTSHLASWGIIVVSPDHPTRDLYHAVAQLQPDVVTDPVDDLLGALDLIAVSNATVGDRFEGRVDLDRVGALGHSAGGGTVFHAAADERIDGYVSMASGLPRDDGDATTPEPAFPDKPSFFLAGALDGVADPSRTHEAFEAVPSPSLFWQIDGVGHNGFDDFCTFGNGTGIIGIAEASGLGAVLDAQPQFRTLGEDGCVPPAVPAATTFPIIDHAVTAFFLHLFGVDDVAQGLGPDVADSYEQQITIEQR